MGAGHQVSKGISLFLSFSFSILVFSWLAIQGPNKILSILVFIGFSFSSGIYLLNLIDAYRMATELSGKNEMHKFHIFLSILFFGYFFILQQIADYTGSHLVKFYTVPSQSMSPNVIKGDYIFVSNCSGCQRAVKRDDIATFIYPNDRTTTYIKRIIGLPGDTVEIKSTDVLVNGKSISKGETNELGSRQLNDLLKDHIAILEMADSGEIYPVLWKKDESIKNEIFKVPFGQVFVLGDNRSHASDSRHFGSLPLTDLVGVAKQIFFSTSDFNRSLKVIDLN